MLSVVAAVLVWLPAFIGLGAALPLPRDPGLRRGVAGMLGLGVAGVLATALNIVAPVGPAASVAIWGLGIAVGVRRRHVLAGSSWVEAIGMGLGLANALYWYQPPVASYDSGLYYIQTVRWMTAHPVRLGLGNLHSRLAHNSIWHTVAAAVELPGLSGHGGAFVGVLPMVLMAGLATRSIVRVLRGGRDPADAVLALTVPVLGYAVRGVGSAVTDPVVSLLVVLGLALWIRALRADDEGFAAEAPAAALVSLLAVMVKVSAAPLVVGALAAMAWRRHALSPAGAAHLSIPCATAIVLWVLRSVLLSGCALFPVAGTCLARLPWAVPLEQVRDYARWVRSWARAPFRSPDEVLGSWAWVGPWWRDLAGRTDVRLFLATAVVGLVLAALARSRDRALWWALGTATLGIGFALFTAPEPRFAAGFLHGLGLVPTAFAISRLPPRLHPVPALLALAVLTALGLRWSRAASELVPWRPDPFAFPRPPAVALVERVSDAGVRIWTPAKGDQCWDAPLPCAPALNPGLAEVDGMYVTRPVTGAPRAR